jgi:hypothetical protein
MDEAPTPKTDAEALLLCHRLLTKAEYELRLSRASASSLSDSVFAQPMSIKSGLERVAQYPAFQFYASLDLKMFGVLRATFQANGYSDLDLWNFLRTAQTALGGMTAAECLVGHHAAEVAELTKNDRDEVLLDLVQEELWRLQQ